MDAKTVASTEHGLRSMPRKELTMTQQLKLYALAYILPFAGACTAGTEQTEGSTVENETRALNDSTGRFLVNALSGKCLDVSGAPGTTNGARLQLWDCERKLYNLDNKSRTDQLFTYDWGTGHIQNKASGKCVDVYGAPGFAPQLPVVLWDCEFFSAGQPSDQYWETWWLTADHGTRQFKSIPYGHDSGGWCLDIEGAPGTATGAAAATYYCEGYGNSDQWWHWSPDLSVTTFKEGSWGNGYGDVTFSGSGFPPNRPYTARILGDGSRARSIFGGRTSSSGTVYGMTTNWNFWEYPLDTCYREVQGNARQVVLEVRLDDDPSWFSVAEAYDADRVMLGNKCPNF
jgi:hypothetical protein